YFYCPGRPLPLLDQLVGIPLDPSRFVERLSAANCGRGYWDEGWHAIAENVDGGDNNGDNSGVGESANIANTANGGRLRVSKSGFSIWVRPADYLPVRDNRQGRPGRVSVDL